MSGEEYRCWQCEKLLKFPKELASGLCRKHYGEKIRKVVRFMREAQKKKEENEPKTC